MIFGVQFSNPSMDMHLETTLQEPKFLEDS
uniref:Uncharacterized protein n=1 Tax=Nelumbo nucifera TaxID=4432 RepID=A0A822YK39_NELNU|nr:TPA_asm: hypothetical protein HUJ06_010127 [Nelumbo nucifera]